MHIFWRETRAHLEVHPHIHTEESSGTLITPDLWMNKCKSPDEQTSSPSSSPKLNDNQQTSPLPLISVAHPSKLLSMPPESSDLKRQQRNKIHRKNKRKMNNVPICTNSTVTNNNLVSDMPQDLRVRHTPISFDRSEPPSSRSDLNSAALAKQKKVFDGLLPPPTILVPYPFLLPIPIPIPIPIPLPISSSLLNRKTNVEQETQTVDEEVTIIKVLNDKSDINEDIDNKIATRPLRKRKRVLEKKTTKVPVKNKRMLLT